MPDDRTPLQRLAQGWAEAERQRRADARSAVLKGIAIAAITLGSGPIALIHWLN